jgi:DNA repair exonuclease SbcCD ATPase subunit
MFEEDSTLRTGDKPSVLEEISELLKEKEEAFISLKAKRELLKSQLEEAQIKKEKSERELDTCEKACALISTAAEKAVSRVSSVFEDIVTPVLKHILGDEYSFKVQWARSSSSAPSAEFLITSPSGSGLIDINPKYKGGGVRDVIGFALRFSFLCLARNSGLVVLDEAFSQLDRERLANMAQSLRYIQEKLGHQIVFITHDQDYIDHADRVVKVEYTGGKSKVTA